MNKQYLSLTRLLHLILPAVLAVITVYPAIAQRPQPVRTPRPIFTPRLEVPAVPKNDWVLVSPNMPVKFLTFDWQGRMYALGLDDEMYAQKANVWERLNPGIKVKSVTVKPDGTVVAPGADNKYIYSRTGTTWKQTDGYVDQIIATKDGNTYALLDGKVIRQGAGPISNEKFKYIAAATQNNALYLVSQSGKVFVGDAGGAGEMPGGGSAIVVAGTGNGLRANIFITGVQDNKTYFFEVTPKNFWAPVNTQTYIKFVALNPNGNVLHGIGVDNRIYRFQGTF